MLDRGKWSNKRPHQCNGTLKINEKFVPLIRCQLGYTNFSVLVVPLESCGVKLSSLLVHPGFVAALTLRS